MALVLSFQPGLAIRRDQGVHGMTIAQITFTMTAGSTTDYPAGGFPLTPKQLGFKGAIICAVAVSGQSSGAEVDIDMCWDFTNSKLKIFTPTGTEISNQFAANGFIRATFIGV